MILIIKSNDFLLLLFCLITSQLWMESRNVAAGCSYRFIDWAPVTSQGAASASRERCGTGPSAPSLERPAQRLHQEIK